MTLFDEVVKGLIDADYCKTCGFGGVGARHYFYVKVNPDGTTTVYC